MKLPRDISADELIIALRKLGYEITRQRGSNIRITTKRDGEHHETVPDHNPLKLSTFKSILNSIAAHHHLSVDQLLELLEL